MIKDRAETLLTDEERSVMKHGVCFQQARIERVRARRRQAAAYSVIAKTETETPSKSTRPFRDFLRYGVLSTVTFPTALAFDYAAYVTGDNIVTFLAFTATASAVWTVRKSVEGAFRMSNQTPQEININPSQQYIKEGAELAQKVEAFKEKITRTEIETSHPLRSSLARIHGDLGRILNRAQGSPRPAQTEKGISDGPRYRK